MTKTQDDGYSQKKLRELGVNLNQLKRLTCVGIFCGALLVATNTRAEEDASQVMTPLSSSSLSGVVETSTVFSFHGSANTFDPASIEVRPVQLLLLTDPGSFAGATKPPAAIESVVYFSRESNHRFSYGFRPSFGSRDTTPSEIVSGEIVSLPEDTTSTLGTFTYGGAENTMPDIEGGVIDIVVTLPDTTSIPEPSTVALFVGGLSLLALRRRKSQN